MRLSEYVHQKEQLLEDIRFLFLSSSVIYLFILFYFSLFISLRISSDCCTFVILSDMIVLGEHNIGLYPFIISCRGRAYYLWSQERKKKGKNIHTEGDKEREKKKPYGLPQSTGYSPFFLRSEGVLAV
ncbi:hypothetical protein BDV25DRAFT_59637 [Aspergillus avenaceus]|uniref:Uncharacterized protein n=1 Tax=Aspergillus avenaceus TaxID=36643 RepID=A0A5N6U2Y0_ASPAV|nr:hypothetical protein BDV25DRAFT_59637 [Aspergillus avenaceus]